MSASVLDRFLGDGSDDDDNDAGMGGGDDLFGGDAGGGGGGGGDFDDFDGMDEWDDAFEEDEDGSNTDELENRIDDLEAEVATLSSTVSTVRSENTEISETVGDVEEDVRNLLDIYEMVTRGINPFVDDSSGFDELDGGDGGSFGLFDEEEGEGEEAEELDDEVAGADADGFFDEDLVEPDDGDDLGDDLDDMDMGDDLPDDGETADAASDTDQAEDDMNHDGKSFSELKEEYDSGEADWADEDAAADDAAGDAENDQFGDDSELEADPFDDKSEPEPEPDPTRTSAPGVDPAEANDGFEYVKQDDLAGRSGKPYLTALPGDYVGDLLVMEWLEFLVNAGDVTDAVRAINYYERIEWVGSDAADRLRDFLSGFGTIDRNLVDQPGTDQLVREHHTRSLRYITQLNGTSSHTILLDRWDDLAGGALVGGRAPEPVPRDPAAGTNGHGSRNDRTDHGSRDGHEGHGSRDERATNGNSSRPMTDPNPQDARSDPAAGGYDNGR